MVKPFRSTQYRHGGLSKLQYQRPVLAYPRNKSAQEVPNL